jgi:outer membrane protein TolC
VLLALAAVAAAVPACESPFADSADRQAYPLIQDRQKRALGASSDVVLDRQMIPVPVTPTTYNKVPPTANTIPAPGELQSPESPATAPAATQQGESATTQPDPLAALLAQTPPIDLANQPELPEFPRPLPPGRKRLTFTLDDAFNYALENSRDYKLRKEDLYIAALDVALARHEFEPQFFAQSSAGLTGTTEASDYSSALAVTQTAGVRQRLPFGGQVGVTGLVTAVNNVRNGLADGTSAEVALSGNLPLLRGAGIVAQENLIQTERSLIYEVREFERFRRAFLVQVASSYFNLVNQRAQVLNRYRSVRSYIFITQRTAALFEAGVGRRRVTQLDLQRAQQSEFQARNDLTNAIQQYESAVDSFKILLGMPASQALDVAPQYLNITPPDVTEAAAVEIAGKLRLDLQTYRDLVDDARRRNKVAANNLLPDLNLTGRVGVPTDPAVRSVAPDVNNLNYSAGATFDWPLDRLAERNAYRVSLINISRSKRTLEQQEDQVAIDVRDALRRVRQQQYLVSLQRSNIDLAVRRKEFADIQFKNGQIDNRDYLDAETALLDAQNRFAQSISALQVATLQYLRDTDQLRVDFKGRLLVPAQAVGVDASQNVTETQPIRGTTLPVDAGKPLPALEPTTLPKIPDPSPDAPSIPP